MDYFEAIAAIEAIIADEMFVNDGQPADAAERIIDYLREQGIPLRDDPRS